VPQGHWIVSSVYSSHVVLETKKKLKSWSWSQQKSEEFQDFLLVITPRRLASQCSSTQTHHTYVPLCTYGQCYFAFTDCVIIIVVALFVLHCYSAIRLSS